MTAATTRELVGAQERGRPYTLGRGVTGGA